MNYKAVAANFGSDSNDGPGFNSLSDLVFERPWISLFTAHRIVYFFCLATSNKTANSREVNETTSNFYSKRSHSNLVRIRKMERSIL